MAALGTGKLPQSRSSSPGDGSRNRLLWLLIDSALIVLIAIGAYYFFYTKSRQTYIAERNYRLLNSAGRQLTGRVNGLLMMFHSAATECADAVAYAPCVQGSSLRQDTTVRQVRCGKIEGTPIAHYETATAYLTDWLGERVLYLSAGKDARRICGVVALSDLVNLTLASKMFQDVLLVGPGGKEVLYRKGPELTQPTEIQKLLIAQWQALFSSASVQARPDGKSEPSEKLSTALVAYAQAVRLPGASPTKTGEDAQGWMIVGLIPSARAFAEQMAVPLGWLIPATYLLLLALLAWPLIKLWQMSKWERLRALDLHLLVFAGLTATGMVSFGLFSDSTETAASARLDDNLQDIAQTLQWRLQDELHCAIAELRAFGQQPPSSERQSIQYYPWFTNLVSVDVSGQPLRTFQSTNIGGRQWQLGQVPNLKFSVKDRPYFRAVRGREAADDFWTWTIPKPDEAPQREVTNESGTASAAGGASVLGFECLRDPKEAFGGQLAPFAIQPLVSRSSGGMLVVLAMLRGPGSRNGAPPGVDVLATRLHSLTQPVLPVGFQFAVVDRDGLVQFHADPTRNLQENFFDETDNHRGLRAAVLARRAELMNLFYYAWPERAYVMPLKDTPWSVIVFHQQLMSFSVSFAVAVAWLLMWGVYLALYVVADVIVQWIRPGYPAGWLWPDRSRRYVFPLLGLAASVYLSAALVLRASSRDVASGVLFVAPFTALALVYVSSMKRPMRGRVLATVIGAGAGAVLLGLNGYSWQWSVAESSALFVALGYAGIRCPARPQRNEWAFRCGYVTVTCALLLVCAVLPSVLFFRDPYQQAARNFQKYVQWRFASDLIERATRVRRELAQASAAGSDMDALVNSRLAMRWDVYDHDRLPPVEKRSDAGSRMGTHGDGSDAAGGAGASEDLCSIDILADTTDTPLLLPGSTVSAPSDRCAAESAPATRLEQTRTTLWNHVVAGMCRVRLFGERALLLWRPSVDQVLLRPSIDDRFADLLPNLSGDTATDQAWEWSGLGHPFTIRERRLNEQIGTAGTCTRPVRIGWGLLPVRFTAGVSDRFVLAGSACALFVFGLVWTIARFLFALEADASAPPGPANDDPSSSAAPETLWSSMQDAEKLAVTQTVAHGVPNPKNLQAIASLLGKHIIVRSPELTIRSPELRAFVRSPQAQQDVEELEKRLPPSDWSRLRGPLSVLVVCLALFLFGTQRGLMDSATALVTGLAGAISAVTAALARLTGIWSRGVGGILSEGGGGERKQ